MDAQDAGDGGGGDAQRTKNIGELGGTGRGVKVIDQALFKDTDEAISSARLLRTVASSAEGSRFLTCLEYKPCLKPLELPRGAPRRRGDIGAPWEISN
jgi:hypothetical protein